MSSKKNAVFYVIMAASLWGSVGIFVNNLAGYGITSLQLSLVRCFITMLVLFFYIILLDRDKLKIKLKELIWFLATGICSIFFFNFFYMKAIKLVGLSAAAVLLYTSPIIVMFLSLILFKEKITFRKILAVILSFMGCVFVTGILSGAGQSITISGLLFGLGAGLCYALYSIFIKLLIPQFHILTILFYTFMVATIGGLLVVDLQDLLGLVQHNKEAFLLLLLAGLSTNALPYILYTTALLDIEASRASVIASIEPIFATLNGMIFLGEELSLYRILGISCIMAAILLLNFRLDRKTNVKKIITNSRS